MNRYLAAVVAAALASFGSTGQAGGLGIGTQSGSGTGNAFAGGAASAEDASTIWYNPAGMTRLPGMNAAIALHALKPSFKFHDRGSTLPRGTGDGGDGGDWAFVPQAFFSLALTDRLHAGVAFNVPFGLATEYESGWRGQAVAKDSELKTYNLNVGLAYKISDVVSVGGGFNYQRADLKFNSVPAAALGLAEVQLDDNSPGFNAGVLLQLTPATRVGLHYRSSIKYDLTGIIKAHAFLGGDSEASASVKTPESASLSFFTALTPQWELMGDITWTAWSQLKKLKVERDSGPLAGGAPFTTLTFNWKDTWRYSLGANYKLNEATKLRFGVAFDQTPSNNTDRTPRVPDQDRTWVAVGVQFRTGKTGILDVGYAHEFIKDAKVDNAAPLGGRLVGKFDSKADILSVQYSHAF